MAIAVIGGFTTATLLTLVIVPVIFTYIDSFYDGLRKTVRYVSATPASRQRLNRKKVRSLRLPIGK
jgi:hypothetical protein